MMSDNEAYRQWVLATKELWIARYFGGTAEEIADARRRRNEAARKCLATERRVVPEVNGQNEPSTET